MKSRSKQRGPTIARLIKRVADRASLPGWNQAVERLAGRGAGAVGPVLRAMHGPVPPGQHARDMVENLGIVLCAMARHDPAPLIAEIERNAVPPDPQLAFVVGALAEAPKAEALPALVRALKHANPFVRWMAAEALIRLRSKRAIGLLVEALRDRSPMVRHAVVQTMHSSKFYRTPAAIEPLRRTISSKKAKRHSPGTWRMAVDLLAELEHARPPKNSGKR
jgi:HEAT repeat protein